METNTILHDNLQLSKTYVDKGRMLEHAEVFREYFYGLAKVRFQASIDEGRDVLF